MGRGPWQQYAGHRNHRQADAHARHHPDHAGACRLARGKGQTVARRHEWHVFAQKGFSVFLCAGVGRDDGLHGGGHTRGSFFTVQGAVQIFYRHGDGRDRPEYQYRQAGPDGRQADPDGAVLLGRHRVRQPGDAARAGYLVTAENAHKKGPSGANCRRRAFL